jgi:hypothetical protein
MSLLSKKSLNLSNSSPILRALMYIASLQTFSLLSSSLRRRWLGMDEKRLKRLKRLNLKNTDLIYRLLLSAIWVVLLFCLLYACCTSNAYTATYPTVLKIVHLNGTSILSLYTSFIYINAFGAGELLLKLSDFLKNKPSHLTTIP